VACLCFLISAFSLIGIQASVLPFCQVWVDFINARQCAADKAGSNSFGPGPRAIRTFTCARSIRSPRRRRHAPATDPLTGLWAVKALAADQSDLGNGMLLRMECSVGAGPSHHNRALRRIVLPRRRSEGEGITRACMSILYRNRVNSSTRAIGQSFVKLNIVVRGCCPISPDLVLEH
jgi:hypothetical protein